MHLPSERKLKINVDKRAENIMKMEHMAGCSKGKCKVCKGFWDRHS